MAIAPLTEPVNGLMFWRAVSAEFAATTYFVYVCVGGALTNLGIAPGSMASLGVDVEEVEIRLFHSEAKAISLIFGLTIFVLVHCVGHVSGANLNPAVTAGLMVTRQISLTRGVSYMVAQYVGAMLGAWLSMHTLALTPETMGGFNVPTGPEDNKIWRAFWTEGLLTGGLVFTVMATIDPLRPSGSTTLGPFAIGCAVMIAHLIAVPITGCGINPARSVGAAVVSNAAEAHDHLWIFVVAPYLGGIVSALIYVAWFAEKNFSKETANFDEADNLPELDIDEIINAIERRGVEGEVPWQSTLESSSNHSQQSSRRLLKSRGNSHASCFARIFGT